MAEDLTKVADLSRQEVERIITRAFTFKHQHDRGIRSEPVLKGQVVAMIFEKPSLRTKVAFEVATHYLGGTPVFLSSSQILTSGGNEHGRESIPDIARNLKRFVDLLVARVYQHAVIEEIAQTVRTPVINALCDRHHPTQALADLMAMRAVFSERVPTVAYAGDGNNVATSLMQICALMGIPFRIASPSGFEIPDAELRFARAFGEQSGVSVVTTTMPEQAVDGVDVVYTDTFVSMGQEAERAERERLFKDFQVNADLLRRAAPGAVFMHCLPAHRGEEVTDEVMDSHQSIVFDQAECRLHVAKAVIAHYLAETSKGGLL